MKAIFLILLAAMVASSCSNSKYPGYDETDNGLFYKIVDDQEGEKPGSGDYIKVNIQYRTMNDSVFFDSQKEIIPVWIPIDKPMFHGDIMEGLNMLTLNDSASFIVRTDTFFMMTIGASGIPAFAERDSMMYVNVRVVDIKNQSEFAQEQELIANEVRAQFEELKAKEITDFQDYLTINKITQKPTASGLIYIPIKNGTGPRLQMGQLVKCHFTGMLIDGQIFDSSIGQAPLEVTVGSPDLIDGFNEALLLLSVGSEGRFIMPSSIAFGESQLDSPIPPYATVIFEISVVAAK